mmetsp:Transcript_7865/g.13587  ORF Transcript_7865/g.13587 Transcript_7865/m.13587 type:complete len:125 (+) Transcript_7865:157-531(+)
MRLSQQSNQQRSPEASSEWAAVKAPDSPEDYLIEAIIERERRTAQSEALSVFVESKRISEESNGSSWQSIPSQPNIDLSFSAYYNIPKLAAATDKSRTQAVPEILVQKRKKMSFKSLMGSCLSF